jgi:hypothetical protein
MKAPTSFNSIQLPLKDPKLSLSKGSFSALTDSDTQPLLASASGFDLTLGYLKKTNYIVMTECTMVVVRI